MTLDQLTADTADTCADLNQKVRDAVLAGKPDEAVRYAEALCSATCAYAELIRADDDD